MRSVRLFTIAGIPVYVHWTFWLLVGAYFLSVAISAGALSGIFTATFILAVFGSVLLHEFGHAAAAAYYGIRTPDITIYPFGGVARLSSLPSRPLHELVIALAGPAVNVVIAAVLLLFLGVGLILRGPLIEIALGFTENLLLANLILVAFNLVPAFPMDGGRVLRSLLAMRTGQLRATEVAASVGRWLALAFALIGIFYGPFSLLLVAGFVYFAGSMELMQTRMRSAEQRSPFGPFAFHFSTSPQSPYESVPVDEVFRSTRFYTSPTDFDDIQISRDQKVIDAVDFREIR